MMFIEEILFFCCLLGFLVKANKFTCSFLLIDIGDTSLDCRCFSTSGLLKICIYRGDRCIGKDV